MTPSEQAHLKRLEDRLQKLENRSRAASEAPGLIAFFVLLIIILGVVANAPEHRRDCLNHHGHPVDLAGTHITIGCLER